MTKTKSESKRFLKRGLATGLTTAVAVVGAILSPTAAMAVEHHAHGHQYPEAWEVPNISTKTDGSTYGLFLKNTVTGAIQPFQLTGLAHHPGYSAWPSTQGQSEHSLIYSSYFGVAPSSDGERQPVGNGYDHQFNIIHGAQGDPSRQMTNIWDARVLFQLADTPVNTKEDAAAVALAIQVLVQRDRIHTEGWTEQARALLDMAKSSHVGTQWVYGSVDAAGNFTEDTSESFGSDSAGSLALAQKAKDLYDEAVRTLSTPDENYLYGTPFTFAWDEGSNTSGTLKIGEDLTLKNGEIDFLDYATYSSFGASFDPALPSKLEAGETYHWNVQSEQTATVQARFGWEELPNTVPAGLVYGDEQIHNLSAIHTAYNYTRQLSRTAPVAPTVDAATVCGESSTVVIPNTTISRLFNYEQTVSEDGKTVTVTATPKSNTVRILPGAQNEWVLELPEVEDCAADDIQVTPITPTLSTDVACGEEATVEIPEVEGVRYEVAREGNAVTVTAVPEEGYSFAEGTDDEWTLEIPQVVECDTDPELPVDPEVVTPVTPTLSTDVVCSEEATVEIPEVEGVKYTQVRDGNLVTVTATAEEGYIIADGAVTEWAIELPEIVECDTDPETPVDPEVVTPVAPTLSTDVMCGEEATVEIPEVEGVRYEVAREGNTVTVTAVPEEGYSFTEGTDSEWTLEIPEVIDCSENPGTDPENPGTDPENPGTDPENPGTDPENPETDPEKPGTDPENPGTDPENPGTDPENPGTDPENPGTDPENPGTDPENPGTDPENPGTDPETDPEKPGTDPENPGTDPEKPGADPEKPGTDPEKPGNDNPSNNEGEKDSEVKNNDGNAKHGDELSATGGSISPIILASGALILIAGGALLVSPLRRRNS